MRDFCEIHTPLYATAAATGQRAALPARPDAMDPWSAQPERDEVNERGSAGGGKLIHFM